MVIPVHDVNPVRRTPWVTYALIIANFVVFLRMPAVSTSFTGDTTVAQQCHLQAFIEQWGAVPKELVQNFSPRLVATGRVGIGPHGPGCLLGTPGYDKSQPLSVLTAMFLHSSWLHLLGNMLFLFIFGNNIEDRMGRLRFLVFYLFCGYVAGYGFAFANSDSTTPLIGASGAIAGVLGAYLVLYPRVRVWALVPFFFFIPLPLAAWAVLGLWFVLQAFYSYGYAVSNAGSVAYLAHVIGFVVGMLVALPLRSGTRPPPVQPRLSWGRSAHPRRW